MTSWLQAAQKQAIKSSKQGGDDSIRHAGQYTPYIFITQNNSKNMEKEVIIHTLLSNTLLFSYPYIFIISCGASWPNDWFYTTRIHSNCSSILSLKFANLMIISWNVPPLSHTRNLQREWRHMGGHCLGKTDTPTWKWKLQIHLL